MALAILFIAIAPLFLSLSAGQPIKLLLAGRRSILFSIVNSEIYIFSRLLWRMKHFLLRLFLMSPSEANLYSSSTGNHCPATGVFLLPTTRLKLEKSLNPSSTQWNKWAAATSNKREKRNSSARAQFIKNSLLAASGHKQLHNSRRPAGITTLRNNRPPQYKVQLTKKKQNYNFFFSIYQRRFSPLEKIVHRDDRRCTL